MVLVYVTGDCHADFHRFSTDRFPDQKEMTRDDIVIICGDFGLWHDCGEERWWLKWLDEKPFTTVFVDGNHENFDRLYSDEFPVVEFHGGLAHRIRPHIYHLMRGSIFEFEGKKFWCFGGARSHDISDGILYEEDFDSFTDFYSTIRKWEDAGKMFRVAHLSWWERELPTDAEMDFGRKTLEENNFEVDYIITHCCPQDIASLLGFRDSDRITMYFSEIARSTKFTKWFFGHYHGDESVWGKFILLYDRIERIL